MPIIEYKCKLCSHKLDLIVSHPIPEVQTCDQCEGVDSMEKQLSTFGTYAIRGNNSASITPKKYRGET